VLGCLRWWRRRRRDGRQRGGGSCRGLGCWFCRSGVFGVVVFVVVAVAAAAAAAVVGLRIGSSAAAGSRTGVGREILVEVGALLVGFGPGATGRGVVIVVVVLESTGKRLEDLPEGFAVDCEVRDGASFGPVVPVRAVAGQGAVAPPAGLAMSSNGLAGAGYMGSRMQRTAKKTCAGTDYFAPNYLRAFVAAAARMARNWSAAVRNYIGRAKAR